MFRIKNAAAEVPVGFDESCVNNHPWLVGVRRVSKGSACRKVAEAACCRHRNTLLCEEQLFTQVDAAIRNIAPIFIHTNV